MFKLLAAFLLLATAVSAQSATQPAMKNEEAFRIDDAVGTQFTIFFSENDARRDDLTFDVSLFITTHTDKEITVEVSVPLISDAFPTQVVMVRRGEVTEVKFNQDLMVVGSRISNKGIRIIASDDIIVYGVNPQKYSSEGFLALPDHLLGEEYFAISMPVIESSQDSATQIGVVALENGTTTVDVTLPDIPNLAVHFEGKIYGPGAVLSVRLRQFQVLQLQHHKRDGDADLSGAHMNCSQLCSAFSGDSRTGVDGTSRDLLVEHLQPVATWGRVFAVPSTPARTDRPDVLKIVCSQDNTYVTIDDRPRKHCDRAGVIHTLVDTNAAHIVKASKPIMCASVVMSQQGPEGYSADPAMTLVIPEEQYAQTYTIATAEMSGSRPYINFITVVIRRDRTDKLLLNGENVNTDAFRLTWKDVPGTGSASQAPLATTYINITAGTHTISTIDADTTFMCIVYGAGDRESYAYMGGMRLAQINPRCVQKLQSEAGDGIDNDCDTKKDEEHCDNTDDDGDGKIDEDCKTLQNDVYGLGDKTILTRETTTLEWRVLQVDRKFIRYIMSKQQPGGRRVQFAEGNGNLVIGSPFATQDRYQIVVSPPEKSGNMTRVRVTLTVESGSLVDTGNYSLSYFGHDGGEVSDENYLQVQSDRQRFEIIASPLEDGGDQRAKSENPRPRNIFLMERKRYNIKFHSIGGQHVPDLPYRLSIDNQDVTNRFQVIGDRLVSVGNVIGLQEVKKIYELVWNNASADLAWNKKILKSQANSGNTRVDAVLNLDALVRPKMNCRAEKMPSDPTQAQAVCSLTGTSNDAVTATWVIEEQDTPFDTIFSRRTYGDYTTWIERTGSGRMTSYLTGIKANQWPAGGGVRVFQFEFTQNGYTLSATVPINLNLIRPIQPPTMKGYIESKNDEITMTIHINEAKPDPTNYNWAVRTAGNLMFNMNVNRWRQDYTSSAVERMANGTLTLTLKTIPMEFDRNVIFTTEAVESGNTLWDGRFVFTIPRAVRTGRVMGNVDTNQTTTVVINAWVEEGLPVSNTHQWRIQMSDGSFRSVNPGESGEGWTTSPVRTNRNGKPSSTLTVTYRFPQLRNFTFTASSVIGDRAYWTASRVFTIGRNEAVRSGRVMGNVDTNQTTTVVINAWVEEGLPVSNTHQWRIQMSDGSFRSVNPGESGEGWTTSPVRTNRNGKPSSTLTVTYRFSQPRNFTFTASSVTGDRTYWTASRVFTIGRNEVSAERPRFEQRIEKGTTPRLIATLIGGSPRGDDWFWTLPDGSQVRPGQSSGNHVASRVNVNGNKRTYYLTFTNGFSNTRQTYRFTASATGYWTVNGDYEVQGDAEPATITARHEIVGGRVIIYMTVRGGNPTATETSWSFTHNGQSYRLIPSESAGSHHTTFRPTRNPDGSMEYKLSIDVSALPNTYTFETSSISGSTTLWRARKGYTVQPVQVPSTTCSLQTTGEIRIGETVRIRCTTRLNDYSAETMELSFRNGDKVISQNSSHRGFTYSQSNGVGYIESSLNFNLPEEGWGELTNWVHKVLYPGGVIQVPIRIPVTVVPTPAPRARIVVGVEGNNVVLTCQLNAARPSFADLVWERQSLGPSRKVQTVYSEQAIQPPFSQGGRYQIENSVSSSEVASSSLKISNLHREDAAKYSCRWGSRATSAFELDVIGTILLVDGRPFNGVQTTFHDGKTYRMQFEFESTSVNRYTIDHNGVDATTGYSTNYTSSSRWDSYAKENIPIRTHIYTDTEFVPQPRVIKTNYKLEDEGQSYLIKQYFLTKTIVPITRPPRVIEITTDNQIHRVNQSISLNRTAVYTFGVRVDAEKCDENIKILFGSVDETARATFRRTTRNFGSYCIITFTRTGYRPYDDHNKIIKIIWEGSTTTTTLTVNKLIVRETTTISTTDAIIVVCTGSGGCEYGCNVINRKEVCTCPSGFELSANGKTCVDINECSQANICGTNERCMNSYGGYICIKLCECDCCELASVNSRSKRSIEEPAQLKEKQQSMNTEIFFPLSGAGVVSWLSVITAVSVIALAVALMNCKRNGFTKPGE